MLASLISADGEPEEHTISDLDVRILPALKEISAINDTSEKKLLSALMEDFWEGKVDFYTLRPFEGDEVNEFGHVVAAVGKGVNQSAITPRRQKFRWSREKFAGVLVWLGRLPGEYRPGPEAYVALRRMDVSTYERDPIYLPGFHLDRTSFVAWCNRYNLRVPERWRKAERRLRAAIAAGAAPPSAGQHFRAPDGKPLRLLQLVDGLIACREVERSLGLDRDTAEHWLRNKIFLGYVESWYDPSFLPFTAVPPDEFPGPPSAWPFEGLFANMWAFDLRLVCITRGSFERALKIAKSRGQVEDLWEDIRLDIERRSTLSTCQDSQFETAGVDDLLQEIGNVPAEEQCRAWLAGHMRQSPKIAWKKRDLWLKEAKAEFARLSERAFGRAWSAALAETGANWNRPGPRSPQ
jgi:hypothetical protein